jgi:hypothetical protein
MYVNRFSSLNLLKPLPHDQSEEPTTMQSANNLLKRSDVRERVDEIQSLAARS